MRYRCIFWKIIMTNNDKNKKSIQDKLGTIKYNCDSKTHLKVDLAKCEKCKDKPCTNVCPAAVYTNDEYLGEITVQYENCLECGACRVICPYGAITWEYPSSGCGVVYKNS